MAKVVHYTELLKMISYKEYSFFNKGLSCIRYKVKLSK